VLVLFEPALQRLSRVKNAHLKALPWSSKGVNDPGQHNALETTDPAAFAGHVMPATAGSPAATCG
jgi:hypothetical protein